MTSLDFLYIALGGGFILLVIFACVLMIYLVLILRDISKISNDAREVSANIKESSEKITEYVVEPIKLAEKFLSHFNFLKDAYSRVKEEVVKRGYGQGVDEAEHKNDGHDAHHDKHAKKRKK